jgi:GNAT superfamily N-acetyltransferase
MITNIGDESPVDENDEPKGLESWGIEGICILPEWQRQGLGKLLVTTGLNFLGTNEKEVAWDPPFTEAGKALLRSLGLNLEDIRLSLGI